MKVISCRAPARSAISGDAYPGVPSPDRQTTFSVILSKQTTSAPSRPPTSAIR
jgi:hypothetical protein